MKAFFLQKFPFNTQTVLFCFCAAGCIYPFCDYLLYLLGWSGWPGWQANELVAYVVLLQWFGMPVVSIAFWRRSPFLAVLGGLLFATWVAVYLALVFLPRMRLPI